MITTEAITNTINKFKGSNAWDNEYNLPLIPMHNNPWIYSAYIKKICGGFNDEIDIRVFNHIGACEVEIGLYNRWPTKNGIPRGGITSFDELLGLAYMDYECGTASDILWYLEKHDGIYINNQMQATLNMRPIMSYNVYRFIFLKPFLKACAGHRVGILSQLQFSAFLIYDLIADGKEPSGRLRIWIMLEAMEKYPITGLVIALWRKIMKNRNLSPKSCFMFYLNEVPIMRKLAPEEF